MQPASRGPTNRVKFPAKSLRESCRSAERGKHLGERRLSGRFIAGINLDRDHPPGLDLQKIHGSTGIPTMDDRPGETSGIRNGATMGQIHGSY